jgi:hypothetical protein
LFLKRFPHASSLDLFIEEQSSGLDDDDDDADDNDNDEETVDDESDEEEDEPLEKIVLSFVETRIWAEDSRRAERLLAKEKAEESE